MYFSYEEKNIKIMLFSREEKNTIYKYINYEKGFELAFFINNNIYTARKEKNQK